MVGKGELLALIDGAPVGVATLTGSVWTWTQHARSRRVSEELARAHGGSIASMRVGGGALDETTDEHFRIWLEPPDRWRFESDRRVDVRNGSTRWVGSSARITELTDDETTLDGTELGLLLAPGGVLLGLLRFGDPSDDIVAERPCLKVSATLNRGHRRIRPVSGTRLGGIDHTYWVDRATGIVLRHVGLVDGEPCTIAEFKELTVNPSVSDLDFRFVAPPGATVARQIDQLVRMAEIHDVDLSGIDRGDVRAVRAAMHDRMRSTSPAPEARLTLQKQKHVPVGPPPTDEAGARASIEYAFGHIDETDGDDDVLVNVQHGRGLVGPLRQAGKRVPAADDSQVGLVVDDVKFLRADEAVVWYSVEVDGARFPMVNGREGRAVKVGERWLVEHAAIIDLLGFAGVAAPSPEE